MDRLHRLVTDIDPFAVEAKLHPSCLRSFAQHLLIMIVDLAQPESHKMKIKLMS